MDGGTRSWAERTLSGTMAAAHELGRWEPLELGEVVQLFEDFPAPWWICGGRALELHLGRSWRAHDDIDVGVLREDASGLSQLLEGWDVEIAASGVLSPWAGSALRSEEGQNNLWCRRRPDQPWCLDVTIGEGTQGLWIFRRDPTIRVPWGEAILRTQEGVPYLAPELQLLYKSKDRRPKDDQDAREVIPVLTPGQRSQMRALLTVDHPWRVFMTE